MAGQAELPSLKEMIGMAPDILSLGARTHALLASYSMPAIADCLARDNWTCGCCGIRIPGYMEVDHLVFHEPCGANELRAICQFCHNLKHPLWAATRGRIRLIWAPGLAQEAIHRIAWPVLFASFDEADCIEAFDIREAAIQIVRDSFRRETVLAEILGSAEAGEFFDSLYIGRRLLDPASFQIVLDQLEGLARFWPVAADRVEGGPIPCCAALSCWREGSFMDMSAAAASDYTRSEWSTEVLRNAFEIEQAGSETGGAP